MWKTTNNGTTFEPIFDGQQKLAVGDIAVAPSNANIVWVGTGDAFTSRSSYAGDGIYKSTDAGKTWTNMGLRDSHHIARIVIHPTNPDIVYVAAMGHLYSDQRRARRLQDDQRRHDLGEGAVRQRQDRRDRSGDESEEPGRALRRRLRQAAAAVADGERRAGERDSTRPPMAAGPGRGCATGCPTGRIGRIGLDIFHGNPDIVYAVIENQNPRTRRHRRVRRRPAGRGGAPARPTAGRSIARTTAASAGRR